MEKTLLVFILHSSMSETNAALLEGDKPNCIAYNGKNISFGPSAEINQKYNLSMTVTM